MFLLTPIYSTKFRAQVVQLVTPVFLVLTDKMAALVSPDKMVLLVLVETTEVLAHLAHLAPLAHLVVPV